MKNTLIEQLKELNKAYKELETKRISDYYSGKSSEEETFKQLDDNICKIYGSTEKEAIDTIIKFLQNYEYVRHHYRNATNVIKCDLSQLDDKVTTKVVKKFNKKFNRKTTVKSYKKSLKKGLKDYMNELKKDENIYNVYLSPIRELYKN